MTRLLQLKISPRAALAAAALALIASFVSGREQVAPAPGAVEPAARPAERAAPAESLASIDIAKLKRAGQQPIANDVLAVHSAAAAAAGTGPAAAQPAPAAPPLPFSYLGRMVDGDKTLVFVGQGAEHYAVTPGLTIDKVYRVEQVTDVAITFVFVPLGTRQVLPVQEQRPGNG